MEITKTLTDQEERVARLLAKNIAQKDIAASEDVTEGFISQLASTSHVKQRIAKLKSADLGKNLIYDAALDKVQNETLHRLASSIHQENDAGKLAMILQRLDSLRRKSTPAEFGEGTGNTTVVNITLPAMAIKTGLIQNDKRQVIQIGELPVISAGASKLKEYSDAKFVQAPELITESTSTRQELGPEDF